MEVRKKNSSIVINSNTIINNGATIISYRDKITIGSKCVIGVDVQIMNSDFHKIDSKDRFSNKEPSSAPIEIGDNVFIGNNVIILKCVGIGNGSTLASGSIVRSSIPENSIFNDRKEYQITEIIS
jgi:maltose O-acetyltransferase